MGKSSASVSASASGPDLEGSPDSHSKRAAFQRLLISAACFYVTVGGAYPLLVLQTQAYGGQWASLAGGAVVGLPLLVTVAATSYWGRYSDRLGARRPLLVGLLVAGGLLFAPMPWLSTWPLVALRTLQMGLLGAGYVLFPALVSEFYPEAKGASLGYFNVASGVGWGAGGLAVGLLVPKAAYGGASTELIMAVMLLMVIAVAGGLMLLGLREPAFTPDRGSWRDLMESGNWRALFMVSLTAFLLMAGYFQLIVFFPDYIVDITGSTWIMGLFFAGAGIIGSVFGGIIGRYTDSYGRRWSLRLALAFYLVFMALYSAVAYPPNFAALENLWQPLPALLIGIAWTIPLWLFFMIAASAMVSDLSPPRQRGRAMGLLQSAIYLGMAVGSLTAGALRLAFELYQVFALGTLIVALAVIAGFTLLDSRPAQRLT